MYFCDFPIRIIKGERIDPIRPIPEVKPTPQTAFSRVKKDSLASPYHNSKRSKKIKIKNSEIYDLT